MNKLFNKNIYLKKGSYSLIFYDEDLINIRVKNEDKNIKTSIKMEYQSWYNEVSPTKKYIASFDIENSSDYNIEIHTNKVHSILDYQITILDSLNNTYYSSNDELDTMMKIEITKNLDSNKPQLKYPLISNTFDTDEIFNICKHLMSGRKLTMDKEVESFEQDFAKYIGSNYAVMVNSGSSANLLAVAVIANYMFSQKLEMGDEVLVPSVCWSTSVWPIIQCGLKPIFVDINLDTLNINEKMEDYISEKTKALFLVHVMGNCANMDKIINLCKKYNLLLIEDTCESLGSSYKDKKLGSFGSMGTYSFFYSHHITTIEGGMVVCNDYEIYNLLKMLRAHGWIRNLDDKSKKFYTDKYPDIDDRYMFINEGYNLRPMELQAVMGKIQLKKLDSKNINRINNYNRFKEQVLINEKSSCISFFDEQPESTVAWFGICILIQKDISINDYKDYLTKNGVENRPIITGNFTKQPYFVNNNYKINVSFPNSDIIDKKGIYIGLSCNEITDNEIKDLVDIILSYF